MPRSPFSILIVFAALTVVGFGLAPRLSLQYLPTARAPRLTVSYGWPNAAPALLEREVTTPLEGAFDLVRGVRRIASVSGEGSGTIRLELDAGANLDYLRFEVAMRIRQLYPRLPEGVSYPQVQVNRPDEEAAERPLLTYSLSGDDVPSVLYRYAREQLAPRLALTAGLQRLDIAGGNAPEWRLSYDEGRLHSFGLRPGDLLEALRQSFQREALGSARSGERAYLLRLQGGAAPLSPADWQAIPIARRGGRLLRLGDLATVQYAEQPPARYYRINGQNSIRLLAYPERGVNTIALAERVRAEVARLAVQLPPSYQLRLEEDSTEYLRAELRKIRDRTLLSLAILLAFVLLAYRSGRYLLLIVAGLVATLGLASIGYYALGVELHLYALAGITVSFGLIIDNTIVMAHHLRCRGDRRVFPALLAATLTTLSALVVLFFLPEQWRLDLLDFALVLMINLAASLAVAWWLIPAIMEVGGQKPQATAQRPADNFRPRPPSSVRGFLRSLPTSDFRFPTSDFRFPPSTPATRFHAASVSFLLRHRKKALLLLVLAFGLPVFWLPNQVEGWPWYNRTLGSDYYVDRIKPHVNRWLGGTLRLFTYYVYEGSGYQEADETVLYVRGSMPPGATLAQLNAVFAQLEGYLAQFERELKLYTTQVFDGQNGLLRITFQPGYDLTFPYLLRSRLIAYSLNLGGVAWNIYGVGKGFSNANSAMPPRFRVKMFGYNKEELARQAGRFAERLLAHPRIQEVDTEANVDWWTKDRYEYALTLDRRALARQGFSAVRLPDQLAAFDQSTRPQARAPDGAAVRLVPAAAASNDRWELEHVQLAVDDSTRLILGDVARLDKRKVAAALHKEDQQYIRMVEFEYTGSARFGSRYLDEVMDQLQRELPLGYTMERITYSFGREGRRLYGLLALVAALIFFVCAVTFESLRQGLLVLLLIPTSFIGIFLTFYWGGFRFDQGGYTSFLLVSGLTVNSLILILNEYNGWKRKAKKSFQRAAQNPAAHAAGDYDPLHLYLLAYRNKILPIFLTILSTSLGMVPFLLGGRQEVFWFALAAGTIGGLAFSLVVITWVTPLFLERKKESGKRETEPSPTAAAR